MKILSLFILFSPLTYALERSVVFDYTGKENGYEAYYACSWAVEEAHRYLKVLGTADVTVECDGGIIPSDPSRPMKLTASFNVLPPETQIIEVKPDPWFTTCSLSSRMIKAFLTVMPHLTIIEKRDRCSHPRNPFYFKLKSHL